MFGRFKTFLDGKEVKPAEQTSHTETSSSGETSSFAKSTSTEEKDEWQWIEGYKGTNANMKCCGGFQFELNKEYEVEGEIIMCKNGFHFCRDLQSTFNYYALSKNNRYFKVKAYVNVSEMRKHHDEFYYGYGRPMYDRIDKLVAKKIILTEEVSFKTLLPYIQYYCSCIETKEDWILANEIGYKEFRKKYFFDRMKDSGFGEAFLCVLFDQMENNSDTIKDVIKLSKALTEENVSKDMAVYLLLKHLK